MKKRSRTEILEIQAEQWNAIHPVRSPVTRYKLINPLREGYETKTRSEAWVMGGHSVMIMVEGVSGGVLLESVRPISSANAQGMARRAEDGKTEDGLSPSPSPTCSPSSELP